MTPLELADEIEGLGRTSTGYVRVERKHISLLAAALRLAEYAYSNPGHVNLQVFESYRAARSQP